MRFDPHINETGLYKPRFFQVRHCKSSSPGEALSVWVAFFSVRSLLLFVNCSLFRTNSSACCSLTVLLRTNSSASVTTVLLGTRSSVFGSTVLFRTTLFVFVLTRISCPVFLPSLQFYFPGNVLFFPDFKEIAFQLSLTLTRIFPPFLKH